MYQICTRCVMDTTDPNISFDANGHCNHCNNYFNFWLPKWKANQQAGAFEAEIEKIKQAGKGKDYDCVLGLSGGVDSSYLAYKSKEWGLRTLLFHVDGGWNTPESENNVNKISEFLNNPVQKFTVDWEEMRDLQRAFISAGVPNLDIPQDHLFFAVLYQIAKQNNVSYWLSGANIATECILPKAWGYNAMDVGHLQDIHKKFGNRVLRNYPVVSFREYCDYYLEFGGASISRCDLLNYIDYDSAKAREILIKECGWQDYGVKHAESYFTRFFQNYILPLRFGFEKRRAHLASIVCSGQITRDEALARLEEPLYTQEAYEIDKNIVLEKLNYSEEDLKHIIQAPRHSHYEYKTSHKLYKYVLKLQLMRNGLALLAQGKITHCIKRSLQELGVLKK